MIAFHASLETVIEVNDLAALGGHDAFVVRLGGLTDYSLWMGICLIVGCQREFWNEGRWSNWLACALSRVESDSLQILQRISQSQRAALLS